MGVSGADSRRSQDGQSNQQGGISEKDSEAASSDQKPNGAIETAWLCQNEKRARRDHVALQRRDVTLQSCAVGDVDVAGPVHRHVSGVRQPCANRRRRCSRPARFPRPWRCCRRHRPCGYGGGSYRRCTDCPHRPLPLRWESGAVREPPSRANDPPATVSMIHSSAGCAHAAAAGNAAQRARRAAARKTPDRRAERLIIRAALPRDKGK